jgi:hypothetical protein
MHLKVDQARRDGKARGVDDRIGLRGDIPGDLRDFSVLNHNIHLAVDAVGRIDDATALDEKRRTGPGCIRIAPGFARSSRLRLIPYIFEYSRSVGIKPPAPLSSCTRRA